MGIADKIKHAWNAFKDEDPYRRLDSYAAGSVNYGHSPSQARPAFSNERSILSSIYTRLSIDVAQVEIRHCRVDDEERYVEDIVSGLNNCLTLEANLDQAARAFRQDVMLTLVDEGVAAIVPVDTTINPELGSFDIITMRVGVIKSWMPKHVRVSVYNEAKGIREEVTLEKKSVAIIYNPLYLIMNEPNSTLQRLIRKLNLLDVVDEQSASGKLDIIIQLPYSIKSEARRREAEQRRVDIEAQLKGSKYGIAYSTATEKITQLNRPAENNLLAQIEFLTEMLYSQLGLTKEVMNGTAEEAAMLNYHNRTIEPMMAAVVEAMRRTFLTKTARTQKQTIKFFRDPFKLVPLEQLANVIDVLARNEVASSNELRQLVGWKPSKDPKADKLMNSNMPQPNGEPPAPSGSDPQEKTRKETVNG